MKIVAKSVKVTAIVMTAMPCLGGAMIEDFRVMLKDKSAEGKSMRHDNYKAGAR